MDLNFTSLDTETAAQVQSWTFPAYRHLLGQRQGVRYPRRGDRRPIAPLAMVATAAGIPAGLVLGCVPDRTAPLRSEMPNEPELLSIYVKPAMRNRGIAGALVAELELAVGRAGFSRLSAVYMTGGADTQFVERLFARRLWSPPQVRMRVFKSTLEQAMKTPWYQRYELGAGLELVAWPDIGPAHLERLKASHQATNWIAPDLVPWAYDFKDLDRASSIGILRDGELVGWVINHRMTDETVRFTCAFIRRDLSRRARILPAVSESVRRAREAGYRYLMFTVPADHREMSSFADRWCAPWSSFHGRTVGVARDLECEGPRPCQG
jgi:GNAT superfamily N-acetyltransferase